MRNVNYCRINSTNNDMQLRREEMDSSMWKIDLYITYEKIKIQGSCFETPNYYPHQLSTIILREKRLREKRVDLSLSILS